jgi:hypothetical protein
MSIKYNRDEHDTDVDVVVSLVIGCWSEVAEG